MSYAFDTVLDRRQSSSSKWQKFPPEVLPMWVADMDFAAPGFILDALRERLDHPILGYTLKPASLQEAFMTWLSHHYGWQVEEEWIVWLPGVVPGLNLAAQCLTEGALMIPTPVYHPFLDLARHAGLAEQRVPMAVDAGTWCMDFDAMEDQVDASTRMVMICNPQNPTGRCYRREELEALAAFCERHDLLLVSDEIHCSIVLHEGSEHLPVAHAFPEIAQRTVSLFSATKAYNIPGISCAAAVIPDPHLRERFVAARRGVVPGIGPLGFVVSETAFRDRGSYLPELRQYLRGNLAYLQQELDNRLAPLEATYLAWIDVRDLALENTEAYFAGHGLGISPGAQFGEPGFIRLNFGCPRPTLEEGVRRLQAGIAAAG